MFRKSGHRFSDKDMRHSRRSRAYPVSVQTGYARTSLLGLLEVFEARRWLILLDRHQVALRAQVIGLVPDLDPQVVVRANLGMPFRGDARLARGLLEDRPRLGQRVVVHRDLVINEIAIVLVEEEALVDHALIVRVQRNGGGINDARSLESAGLDVELVVMA